MFKNVFLKLRFTVRKARICLRTFYWSSERRLGKRGFSKDIYIFKNTHSKKTLGKRGPRVRPTHLMCPQFTRGKNQCFFPLMAPLFPSATVGPRSHLKMGPAAGRRTNTRPKRLNGLFYLPGFILGCSMGQIRRMGGRKARQKRIFHQTRGFNLLSFRRPCTEFDLTRKRSK